MVIELVAPPAPASFHRLSGHGRREEGVEGVTVCYFIVLNLEDIARELPGTLQVRSCKPAGALEIDVIPRSPRTSN